LYNTAKLASGWRLLKRHKLTTGDTTLLTNEHKSAVNWNQGKRKGQQMRRADLGRAKNVRRTGRQFRLVPHATPASLASSVASKSVMQALLIENEQLRTRAADLALEIVALKEQAALLDGDFATNLVRQRIAGARR
jgi:hypothetical protein